MKNLTVSELAKRITAEIVADSGALDAPLTGYYAGDFLSNVMTYAKLGSGWFTVMTNVNVAGAASMAGVKCIIVCEGKTPDSLLVDRARDEGIAVLKTALPVYDACTLTL